MYVSSRESLFSERQIFFLAAALLAVSGALISPDLLRTLGLMDRSLDHELELVRRTTLFEIQALRILALVGALFCLLLGVFWPSIASSTWYENFVSADVPSPSAYEEYKARVFNMSFWCVTSGTILLSIYALTAHRFLDQSTLVFINREDGFIEALSAVVLLVAAAVSFRVAWRVGMRDRRFAMHVLLGLLFIVMCGEEISWGQRYLGLETPESIAAVNVQGEINFHNMFGYLFDHIFIAAFFAWMVLVPLASSYSRFFRHAFWRVGLPVGSLGIAAASFLIYLIFMVFLERTLGTIPGLRLAEPRELLSAICFLVLMMEVLVFVPSARPQAAKSA